MIDKYTGKKLDGRYEIHELIGVGGMANVYRCYDTIVDREVAIKILKEEFLDNADFIRRFKNESKSIAVLSHPNIVRVYDVSFGDMIQYIVMEYIDGITLKEYIAQQGVIQWKEALHLTTQILRALQHAHEKGIVHRDIKPQNIMLLQDGTIKVTDFGIARNFNSATRTMTEQAIGSVHYIAPEQAKGGNTDGKTDIYSVGVMMYEMLTGKLPFVADNAVSVAIMQLQSTPKLPREINPDIPQGLEEITLHAMQKNPTARYESAQAMLNDIDRFRLNPSIVFGYSVPRPEDPKVFEKKKETKKREETKRIIDDKGLVGNVDNRKNEQEDFYNDDFEKKEMTKKKSAIIGVVASFLVCLIGFGIYFISTAFTGTNADTDVPNYIGKTILEVKQEDNKENFVFKLDFQYDSTKKEGVILSQEPEPDSKKVKKGSTIELTVNGKNSDVTVPHLLNTTEEDAIKELESRNLVPEIVYVNSDDVNVNYVSSEFPNPGQKTTIGSSVYLYVSKGPAEKKVKIPDVTGKNISEAEEILTSKGLFVQYEYDENSYEEKDTVIRQNPLQGGTVKKGYTVKLVLSGGKKDAQSIQIDVQLPQEETNSVSLQVVFDGDVFTTTNVIPSELKTYSFTLTGTESDSKVKVYLNGQLYQEYAIDFQNKTASPTYHDYVVATTTTEPATTEDTTTVPIIDDSTTEPDTSIYETEPTQDPEPTTVIED